MIEIEEMVDVEYLIEQIMKQRNMTRKEACEFILERVKNDKN